MWISLPYLWITSAITFFVSLYYSNNTAFRKLELFHRLPPPPQNQNICSATEKDRNTVVLPLWGQIKPVESLVFSTRAIADSSTHQLKNPFHHIKNPNHQKIPTLQQKFNFSTSKPLIVPLIAKIPQPRYFRLFQIQKIKIPPIQNFTSKSQIFLLNKEIFDAIFPST